MKRIKRRDETLFQNHPIESGGFIVRAFLEGEVIGEATYHRPVSEVEARSLLRLPNKRTVYNAVWSSRRGAQETITLPYQPVNTGGWRRMAELGIHPLLSEALPKGFRTEQFQTEDGRTVVHFHAPSGDIAAKLAWLS